MSVNPSASQAAALAAFKAKGSDISNKKQGFQMPSYSLQKSASAASLPRQTERPKPVLYLSSSNKIHKIQTNYISPAPVKSKPSKLTIPTTPKVVPNSVGLPVTPVYDSPKIRPSPLDYARDKSFVSVGSDVESTESWAVDYFNLYKVGDNKPKFKKLSSQHSNLSSNSLAQDMIQSVKRTIDSKAIANNQSQKRLSSSYEPNEMLKNVRYSINSKAKSYSQVEMTQMNQSKINEFRESIEQKRISNVPGVANFRALSSEDVVRVPSHNSTISYKLDSPSCSSSVISAILDSEIAHAPDTPMIVVDHHLPDIQLEAEDRNSNEAEARNSNEAEARNSNEEPQLVKEAQNLSLDEMASHKAQNVAESQMEPQTEPQYLSLQDTLSYQLKTQSTEKVNEASSQPLLRLRIPDQESKFQELQEPITLFDNRKGSVVSIPSTLSVYSPSLHLASSESLTKEGNLDSTKLQEEFKSKPRRKPPPGLGVPELARMQSPISFKNEEKGDIFWDITSTRKPSAFHASPEYSSSKSLISNNDNLDEYGIEGDTDFAPIYDRTKPKARKSEEGRFPQFPDFNVRAKHIKKDEHRHLFKKIYKSKGVDGSAYLLTLDNEEGSIPDRTNELAASSVSRPSTPIISHQNQPVQLKATMRKTNKRKERKLFNENKPWKNHSDLSYITEQERKRYEGVWASNKGNYMSHVVTRLVGVDYDHSKATETATEEEEASTKAARLSSKLDSANNDQQNFHNLISAQPDQLIHGLVVKKIWSRSRLPKQTLETIWNLVDLRKDGTLNKPEFIVGMWIVDQCLYGRKLNKKVEDEVWESLGNIGVSVVLKKKGRR